MINQEGYVKSKIKLTIGILISNRIQYIEKVMFGIKPLLDELPAELIAVDTVGPEKTDGSIEVVKRFTSKIYPFKWCNDFAKARNVCLENASGEWFMFLDDDEVFEDVTEIVDFFKTGECEDYLSGIYHLKNHLPNNVTRMSTVLRMVRRKPDTRFVGRIHEAFNEVYEPCKLFEAYVNHYGYLFLDKEAVKRHQERNLSILEEEIEKNGLNASIGAQLVQELIFTEGTEERGYKELKKCLSLLPKTEISTATGQWLLAAGIGYYYNLNRHEEALAEAKKIKESYSLNETCALIIEGTCIYSAAKLEKWDECIDAAKRYARVYEFLEKNRKEAIRQITLGSEDYKTIEYARGVLAIGISACLKEKRFNEALEFLAKLKEYGCEPIEEYSKVIDEILFYSDNKELKNAYLAHFLTDEGMKLYRQKV